MKNIIKLLSVAALALSLNACFKAQTFEERLAGKTNSEREQEAYYACIERSQYPVPGGHPSGHTGHEIRMRAICDAMHETNLTEEK